MSITGSSPSFVEAVNFRRKAIKEVAASTKELIQSHKDVPTGAREDHGEVMANLTLAYRKLEDASMRLGKVLQAYDGGVSVYDKDTTVGA